MPVRVLIVDDLQPFRSAARAVVEATPGFQVVGEAANGEDSIVAAQRLRPDLVLMDVNLPGMNGIEATQRILAGAPQTVVLLLSTRDAADLGSVVADAGAAAYVAKSSFGPERLAQAWSIADGRRADPNRPSR